jgi:hypothetical protein
MATSSIQTDNFLIKSLKGVRRACTVDSYLSTNGARGAPYFTLLVGCAVRTKIILQPRY